jgi:hypothetical protein
MRYFGTKSLSSVVVTILSVFWVLTIIVTVLAPVAGTAAIYLSTPQGQAFIAEAKSKHPEWAKANDAHSSETASQKKENEDWEQFKDVPLPVKILLLPYGLGVLALLLVVLKRARTLFKSFRDEPIFRRENEQLMRGLAKLLIILGIATFDRSTLLIAVILLMACEVIKNGTVLQEEHDLTV